MVKCSRCGTEGHNKANKRCCPMHPDAFAVGVIVGKHNQSLRAVLPAADIIWEYRDDIDAYSNKNRANVHLPERDHVFEIQLADTVYKNFQSVRNGPTTRGEVTRIENLFNSEINTNITSMAINRSKKGPFTCVKNKFIENGCQALGINGVDHYVYCKNGQKRAGKYTGFSRNNWENIKTEVVRSYDLIDDGISNAIHHEADALMFQGAMNDMFSALKLE